MIIVSSGTGTVTNINTTAPLSGGPITTSGTITTTMATNKLIGRSTAGSGVMEEITVGTGLSLTGGTLSSTGGATAAGSTNEIQFNNGGAFAASSNLDWIISDNRLLLGSENTADINSRMVVIGKGISTNNTFVVHNSTGTNNALVVRDDGTIGIGTASPGAQLHIDGAFPNKIGLIINGTNLTANNGSTAYWQNNGVTRGVIYVADSGSDALRGIKISNPTADSDIMVAAGNRGITISNQGSFTNTLAYSTAVTNLLGASTPLTVFGRDGSTGGSFINHIQNTQTVGRQTYLLHRFLTSTNVIVNYGGFGTELMVNTNAAHSGDLFWSTALTGTFAERMRLKASGNLLLGTTSEGASATKTLVINNGTAPSGNVTDSFQQYSADIVAGNAAPHFRTENGNVVKIYQETTSVPSATFVQNSGTRVDEVSTFDGYTIAQVVRALRNQGLLA